MRFATQPNLFLSILLIILSWSQSTLAADSQVCEPKNYRELVSCAERKSSGIAISLQQLKSSEGLVGVAEQLLNPELEADSVYKGSDRSETNATLLFPIRLGGKRNALIGEAKSEAERARAVTGMEIQQSRLEVMLALHRLGQLKRELGLAAESVETYSKIVSQFQKRPALSPEQDVSLSVFRIASADYQLRLTNLKADEEALFHSLTALTGIPKSQLTSNLPSTKSDWPIVEPANDEAASPQLRIAAADLELARSRKERADAEAWPDLRIGPSIKAVKENGESSTYVGVGLSIPLPVFSQNAAGKVYSNHRLAEAELGLEQAKRKASATRAQLANRYSQTVRSLKDSISPDVLHGKHERLERQFFKGLVPSALVIEAHRQLFDLEQRRNASEIEALESLGRILILDNKFNEVIL